MIWARIRVRRKSGRSLVLRAQIAYSGRKNGEKTDSAFHSGTLGAGRKEGRGSIEAVLSEITQEARSRPNSNAGRKRCARAENKSRLCPRESHIWKKKRRNKA